MGQSTLTISDLRLWVHLGCSSEEKFHKQMVSVSINIIFTSELAACLNDNISSTICYFNLTQTIKKMVGNKPFNLIEHLAYFIQKTIKSEIQQNHNDLYYQTDVTVNKLSPPVEGIHGGVQFKIFDDA